MPALNKNLLIRPEIAAKLGHYVYAYIDPRTADIFYVGKGCRSRVYAHFDDEQESEKTRRIKELHIQGMRPHLDIIAHGMTDHETALRVEAAIIDVLSPGKSITNRVKGFRSIQFGRHTLADLEAIYAAKTVTIREPALLIRINQRYRPGINPIELYEATRGIWKLGERREQARYAFAVFEGIIREVYQIHTWHKAGTTQYFTREIENKKGRWEFLGIIDKKLSNKYRNCSARKHIPKNSQNPVAYVNC